MSAQAVYEYATEYVVTAVPPEYRDNIDAGLFALRVVYRGRDKWAVTDGVFCFNKSGGNAYEPQPSSRTDRFLKAYRHDFGMAMFIARKEASRRKRNGMTVADYIARCEQQDAS